MTAKQFAQQLIDAGRDGEVILAARYAALRAATLIYQETSPDADKLFAAIDRCEDAFKLEELAAFCDPEFIQWGAPIDATA